MEDTKRWGRLRRLCRALLALGLVLVQGGERGQVDQQQ